MSGDDIGWYFNNQKSFVPEILYPGATLDQISAGGGAFVLGHFLTVGLLIRLCWWKVLIGQFCLFADGQKKGTLYSKSLRP